MVKRERIHLFIIAAFIAVLLFLARTSVPVHAASGIVAAPGRFTKSGHIIYYELPEPDNSGNACIYKYNLKTGKSKKIYSSKDGGYGNISIKGKYLYVEKSENHIDADDDTYFRIYRINKNGKKAKFLDYGRSPVIIGSWIYYFREIPARWEDGEPYTYYSGFIYKMKLNGSSKKKVCKTKTKYASVLFKVGSSIVYSKVEYPSSKMYSIKGKVKSYYGKINRPVNCFRELNSYPSYSDETIKVRSGVYRYYACRDGSESAARSLYREKIKGGNRKCIYTDYSGFEVWWFEVRNGYIMLYCQGNGKTKLVLMKADGSWTRTLYSRSY